MKSEISDKSSFCITRKGLLIWGWKNELTSIEAKNLQKGFDGRSLINGLSFSLPRNGIVGVIGPNGVGKSTLFKTIVGLEKLDGGDLKIGETVKISYVDQSRANIDPDKTLWEVVSDGLDYMKVNGHDMSTRAYVGAFNFKGADQQKKVGQLSGGERNRVNLAKMLKSGANVLLLDEPTNDLDVETLDLLQDILGEFDGTVLLVSHDRDFIDRIATATVALEGQGRATVYPGGWSDYAAQRPTTDVTRAEDRAIERLAAPPADKGGKAAAKAEPAPVKSRPGLTFTERKRLDALPAIIAKLEAEQAEINQQLNSGQLYAADAARAAQLGARHAEIEGEWLQAMERWEALGGS